MRQKVQTITWYYQVWVCYPCQHLIQTWKALYHLICLPSPTPKDVYLDLVKPDMVLVGRRR